MDPSEVETDQCPFSPEPPSPGSLSSDCSPLEIEPLAAWHLPLLGDPAFVPLQPLLQRSVLLHSVLLNLPDRLLHLLSGRPGSSAWVLVARRGALPQGLIVTRQCNRRGSCWQVQHLRLAVDSGRRELAKQLLREAILRAQGATSWIATSSSLDLDRLAALREQGFQPLRTERLWRWLRPQDQSDPREASAELVDLALQALHRRNALAMLQLEQAACPAQLRQLLDRCSDDLLDQSRGRGWMLLDRARNQAVAAVRWLGDHPGGGHDLELTVHPGWSHLICSPTERMLQQACTRINENGGLAAYTFTPGERVRLMAGPLAGLEAAFLKRAKSGDRALVLLRFLNQESQVTVDLHLLEKVNPNWHEKRQRSTRGAGRRINRPG